MSGTSKEQHWYLKFKERMNDTSKAAIKRSKKESLSGEEAQRDLIRELEEKIRRLEKYKLAYEVLSNASISYSSVFFWRSFSESRMAREAFNKCEEILK